MIRLFFNNLGMLVKDKKGQTMVEYALILALVAIVVITFIPPVTTAISTLFTLIATSL